MNRSNQLEDLLLASAIRVLTSGKTTFSMKAPPMPKSLADAKAAEMKAAAKKIKAKGIARPRHRPTVPDPEDEGLEIRPVNPADPFGILAKSRGVDNNSHTVVESNFPSSTTTGETNMTTKPEVGTDGVAKAAAIKAEKEALKAKQKAEKEALKAAKIEAALAAKAEKDTAAAAKKEAAERVKAEKKAIKEAERANKPSRERTYEGSMLSLANRVASGAYTKGVNGQLRSNDDVAIALESIPAKRMVSFLCEVLGVTNSYGHLNYGQQSMNLRNKLRGTIKAGTEVNGVKITVDHVKSVRDAGNWTAEPELQAA